MYYVGSLGLAISLSMAGALLDLDGKHSDKNFIFLPTPNLRDH
jgi:hypothetical protein